MDKVQRRSTRDPSRPDGVAPRASGWSYAPEERLAGRIAALRVAPRAMAALLLVSVLAMCRSHFPGEDARRGGGRAESGQRSRITVFAAASLSEPLQEIASLFESAHPGVTVRLNLAGSQRLAGQILAGSPADLFVSANRVQMERVARERMMAGAPVVVLENSLAIVVEAGNPAGIETLAGLARPGLKVVLGAEEVPVGAYAGRALAAAGVRIEPVSRELDAKQVVTKVVFGEADAGIAYRTDVRAGRGRIEGIPLGDGLAGPVRYLAGILDDAPEPRLARSFLAFLQSERGGRIFRDFGFTAP